MIKGQIIKCKTCDTMIAGCLESAMGETWNVDSAKYVETGNVIIEDVDDITLIEYRAELNKCCEKRWI